MYVVRLRYVRREVALCTLRGCAMYVVRLCYAVHYGIACGKKYSLFLCGRNVQFIDNQSVIFSIYI